MKINYSDKIQLGKGNLNTAIENGVLILPAALKSQIEPTGIDNAEGVFGVLLAVPEIFAAYCDWTKAEMGQAIDKLRTQLRGHIADEILDFDPAKAPKFSTGARPPKKNRFHP